MRVKMSGGARASARFNVRHDGALETPSPLSFCKLKRREHRAPVVFMGWLLILFCLALFLSSCATSRQTAFRPDKLAAMDAAILNAIASNQCPGGVLWVEHNGVAYHKAFGHRALVPVREAMTEDTIFDA